MTLSGPAAGHALLKTQADPEGRTALGTFNNCANGPDPWGTYLTCEENFNGYFGSEGKPVLDQRAARYGLAAEDAGFGWHRFDERFDLAKHPQEPHRFGWVVEIDPRDPASTPKKRTALGRFKHENAAFTVNQDGRAVVYLGDDERGAHLPLRLEEQGGAGQRPCQPGSAGRGHPLCGPLRGQGGELKGTGQWLPLVHGQHGLTRENGFADQGRCSSSPGKAATRLGATTMDRPEWVAVHPHRGRGLLHPDQQQEPRPQGEPTSRWRQPQGREPLWPDHPLAPDGDDHGSDSFEWDLFLLAGNPGVHKEGLMAGSANIHPDNMFNSPDGIGFDEAGRLWIQTDGDYSNEKQFAGMGNNQMLCADPASGEVRRFLTGPVACEITGLTFTPDWRTLFVGVQHPGEEGALPFPGRRHRHSPLRRVADHPGRWRHHRRLMARGNRLARDDKAAFGRLFWVWRAGDKKTGYGTRSKNPRIQGRSAGVQAWWRGRASALIRCRGEWRHPGVNAGYSRSSAWMGSSLAARRAGAKPNITPIRLAQRQATPWRQGSSSSGRRC